MPNGGQGDDCCPWWSAQVPPFCADFASMKIKAPTVPIWPIWALIITACGGRRAFDNGWQSGRPAQLPAGRPDTE
jgi:hypothetical protein